MKKFVLEYYNDLSEEERAKAPLEAWNKWFGGMGAKVADGGNPFAPNGMAVEKSGVSKITNHPATGYTIVNAADMDEAVELAKGCPVLEAKDGAVRVYEALPM